jgi:hypothetical protein
VDRATFVRPGRTAWVPVDDRTSLKLKGVGLWRGPGTQPVRPSTDVNTRPRGHVGFTDSGRLRLIDSAPAPVGGITVDRAAREFRAAMDMWITSATGIRPVRLYRLAAPALHFPPGAQGEPLGAVVTLVPTAHDQRLDTLFRPCDQLGPAEQGFVAAVRRGRPVLDALAALAGGYGRALRVFTATGFFRHSGSIDNWAVVPGSDAVFLTDLDSTRMLADVPAVRRPLEILRDLASGVFGLAAALMLPAIGPQAADATAEACFTQLVAGYLPEVAAGMVDDAVAPFCRYWTPLAGRSWAGSGAHLRGADRSIWMDRDLAYCLLLRGLAPAYAASEANGRWGELDTDRLVRATRDFLGPGRFRRLSALLAH